MGKRKQSSERWWNESNDPVAMVERIEHKASERKCRLIACALCRLCWEDMDVSCQTAIAQAEQFADSLITESELEVAREAAEELLAERDNPIAAAVVEATKPLAWGAAFEVVLLLADLLPPTKLAM